MPEDKYNVPKINRADLAHMSIKALLSYFPIVSDLFGYLISPSLDKRKNQWMNDIANGLLKLEENDKNLITRLQNSEEFISLLLLTSEIAIKTHSSEKHRLLKNALMNFENINFTYDKKFVFVKYIEELSDIHIYVLMVLYKNHIKSLTSFKEINEKTDKIEIEDLKFYTLDLAGKGLISISSPSSILTKYPRTEYMSLSNNTEKINTISLEKTKLGEDLIDYLQI